MGTNIYFNSTIRTPLDSQSVMAALTPRAMDA
jgi:hypothetical protein